MGRLQEEIRQRRPFRSLEEEAFLNIERTASQLLYELSRLLRSQGLSPPQYNVLRILRGARPAPLACHEIAERMVTRVSDITRLLDRLEARGLVRRCRQEADRRVIATSITAEGLAVLERLDEPVTRFHRERLGHLGEARLRALIELLEAARLRPEAEDPRENGSAKEEKER